MKTFGKVVLGLAIAGLLIGGGVFIVKKVNAKNASNKASSTGGVSSFTSVNTDGNPIKLTRAATWQDIDYNEIESISDALVAKRRFNIVPKVDITNLTVTITFRDKDEKKLKNCSQSFGNVIKNSTYIMTCEFEFIQSLKIETYQVNVSTGEVSYFA